MPIKAVFFDLIGTLAYAEKSISFEDISDYLFERGYEVSPQQFKASWLFVTFIDYPKHCYGSWEIFIDRVLSRLGIKVDEKTFRELVKTLEEQTYTLYPDALVAIPQVKRLGLKTAIVTTTPRFMFYKCIQPIEEYIDYVITGCEAGCDKSNPKMYLKLLALLKVKPNECVVVGDDIQLDVRIPKKLGIHTILLDRRGSYSGTVPDIVVRDLNKAVKAMEILNNCSPPKS